MKKRIFRLVLSLVFISATITVSRASYILSESPNIVDENQDESSSSEPETKKKFHKVVFNNNETGKTYTKYYEDGYVLSMADLADLTANDTNPNPESLYLQNGKYLSWNSSGVPLSKHIVVDKDLVIEGNETSYITSGNIKLNSSDNNPNADRSYEASETATLSTSYKENLSPGSQFIGTPDNIIFLTSEAYNINQLQLELMAVHADALTMDGVGIYRSFKNGEYNSVTNVNQNEKQYAVGQSINIRLSSDSGKANGYGEYQTSGGLGDLFKTYKFISKNADTTIGLSNPESNQSQFPGAYQKQTPYKSQNSGAYTYSSAYNSYSTNYCANRIVLENDVIFTGSLTIGGITGFYGNNIDFSQTGYQGYINGSYCEIDLNGYDLILTNRSSLISYGSITDSSRFNQNGTVNTFSNSTDTGSLVLLSGSVLQSPFVFEDVFLPISAPESYFNSNSPFHMFRCPYIDCKTIFYAGSKFQAEYKIDLAGISDPTLLTSGIVKLIGSSSDSDCLLSLKSGKIVRETTYLDNNFFSSHNITSILANIQKDLFNQQIEYSIEDAHLTFANWSISFSMSGINMNFDSRKYQFFIPYYYQIKVIDSLIDLNQELIFMTGSSLYLDKNSTLILGYSDILTMPSTNYCSEQEYQSVGGLTFLDTFYYSEQNETYYKLIDANNITIFENVKDFWKSISKIPAYGIIEGKIEFKKKENVTQHHPFCFGGQIDIKDFHSFKQAISEWNSSSSQKVRLFGNYFMMGPNTSGNKASPNISGYYMRGFYTPPLMTRKNEVLVDVTTKDYQVVTLGGVTTDKSSSSGTTLVEKPTFKYNSTTGLISDGSSNYAFIPDYSWSHSYDVNDERPNFYFATSFDFPDDLAGSFWPVTCTNNYVSINGRSYEGTKTEDNLTYDRKINVFYRGCFVQAQKEDSDIVIETYLYRFAGIDGKDQNGSNGESRSRLYTLGFKDSAWNITG